MKQFVWAIADFEVPLIKEFQFRNLSYQKIADLIYKIEAPSKVTSLFWSQAIGEDVGELSFNSISDAQKKLKALAPLWSYYPIHSVRRGQLISDGIKSIKNKIWKPFQPLPSGPLAVFSLLNDTTLLYCIRIYPSIPIGSLKFSETSEPPSRAYLKLWEALTYMSNQPQQSESVLELGSSPGGWTWVLANQLKCQVTCVDRGVMDSKIVALKNVNWLRQDAFNFTKQSSSFNYHWLFSDMACDPAKLLTLVKHWVYQNPNLKCICTIKLTDQIDNVFELLSQFTTIPHSQILHLNSNGHELTWLYLNKS